MAEPDFTFPLEPGEPLRVTVGPRKKAWHFRIGEQDLYVQVSAGDVHVPPEVHIGPEAEDLPADL